MNASIIDGRRRDYPDEARRVGASPALLAMVCRAAARLAPVAPADRYTALAALIAEQRADMAGGRVAADGNCHANLPAAEGRNWRRFADQR